MILERERKTQPRSEEVTDARKDRRPHSAPDDGLAYGRSLYGSVESVKGDVVSHRLVRLESPPDRTPGVQIRPGRLQLRRVYAAVNELSKVLPE